MGDTKKPHFRLARSIPCRQGRVEATAIAHHVPHFQLRELHLFGAFICLIWSNPRGSTAHYSREGASSYPRLLQNDRRQPEINRGSRNREANYPRGETQGLLIPAAEPVDCREPRGLIRQDGGERRESWRVVTNRTGWLTAMRTGAR